MSTQPIKLKTEDQIDVILSIYDEDPADPTPVLMYYNKPNNWVRVFNGVKWGSVGIAWDVDEPAKGSDK
jgi:hypothetical protein